MNSYYTSSVFFTDGHSTSNLGTCHFGVEYFEYFDFRCFAMVSPCLQIGANCSDGYGAVSPHVAETHQKVLGAQRKGFQDKTAEGEGDLYERGSHGMHTMQL